MGKGEHLGELEHLVLLAILSLGQDDAYGMRVRRALQRGAGRSPSVPTVYSALDRLEAKGLVSSRTGEATPERGGRAKKLFQVTPAGVAAVREAKAVLERMWSAADVGQGAS